MKKRTKLTICLGVICALLVAISSWYTMAYNNSRFIAPMDLSEYVFRAQDLPMIISGVFFALYVVYLVVLLLRYIMTNRRRELTLQSTRTINPKENKMKAQSVANKTSLSIIFLAILILGQGKLMDSLEYTLIAFVIVVALSLALEIFLSEYLLYHYDNDEQFDESEE